MKWFNPDKGFGFVELTDGSGEAFLHVRQVEASGNTTVPSGATLMVRVGPGQKGQQVTEILSVDASTAEPEPPRGGGFRSQGAGGAPSRGRPPGGSRPVAGAPDTDGVVKWYDEGKGYGFIAIEGESKDLFVHVSALERAGLSRLDQGQAVRVAIVEGRKGREVGAIELA